MGILRALFDEKRRDDIRHAIRSGNPIAFRRRVPSLEPSAPGNPIQGLISTIGEDGKEAFQKAMGKPVESATFEDLVKFLYGDYPKGRPVSYDDIAISSKPPGIAGVGDDLFIPRNNRGGRG
jgi:hypothetical protein